MKNKWAFFDETNETKQQSCGEYSSPVVNVLSMYQNDVITMSTNNDFDIDWGEDWGE